ncbi:MAG: FliM/FliN family flagellar motor switch protein [Deferribacteraceae bacterium]|jgi:flagellar motor switch protein FliM|nr:FliM/FliN family flagellar motor switch protein [Deferribacteraceae bacterium]
MADILSPDEIAALLFTHQDDDDFHIPRKLSVYDFRRPDRISKWAIRSCRDLMYRCLDNMQERLSALLQTIVAVGITSINQQTYGEFVMALPDPTCFAIFDGFGNEQIVFNFTPRLYRPVIDKLTGGGGLPLPPYSEISDHNSAILFMTAIDQEIMSEFIDIITDEFSQVWQKVIDIKLTNRQILDSPHIYQIMPQNDVVITYNIKVEFGDVYGEEGAGEIAITLPAFALDDTVINRIYHIGGNYNYAHKPANSIHMEANTEDICVDLYLELPRMPISIKALSSIKTGDIFAFNSKDYLLYANDLPIFSCKADLANTKIQASIADKYSTYEEINMATEENKLSGALLDIKIPLSIRLGKAKKALKEIYAIEKGTIITMDDDVDALVDLIAGNKLIAKGEVMVVDGQFFGIRIKEVITHE